MLNPLGDRVIVKRDETPEKEGSIIVPDNAKQPPVEGTVVAVGPGRRAPENGVFIETTLKPGERVMFGPYIGVDVLIEDEKHLIMREDEILGKFQPE